MALTIILIVFSIATTIFVNTTFNSVPIQKIKARELLKIYSEKTNEEKSFFDEEIKEGDFVLKKEIKNDSYKMVLLQIQYSISNANGSKIEGWQELVQPK